MKFINSLSELEGMCCDMIVRHDDVLLQHSSDTQFGYIDEFVPKVYAYDLEDGSLIGELTEDFEVLVTIQNNGKLLITVTSKRMPLELCDIRCFYLRVEVRGFWDAGGGLTLDTKIFDKYTSCFKVMDCCIVPSGISVGTEVEPQVIVLIDIDEALVTDIDGAIISIPE